MTILNMLTKLLKNILSNYLRSTTSTKSEKKATKTQLSNHKSNFDSQEVIEKMNLPELDESDHLGDAAKARYRALEHIKNKEFDEAWKALNEQKEHYLNHAKKNGFTKLQTLALDASAHEDMANILRLEKKHNDALVNILYWVRTSNNRSIQRHENKLRAYFNRCKYKNTNLDEAIQFSKCTRTDFDLRIAQLKVNEWIQREKK